MAIVNLALGVAARAARLAPEGSPLHTLGTGIQAFRRGQTVAHLVDDIDTITTAAPALGLPATGEPAADGTTDVDPEPGSGGLLGVVVGWLTGEQ